MHTNRRTFLQMLIGIAVTGGALPARAADLPKLPENDAAAKALGYVEQAGKAATDAAYKKGSTCGGCALYQAAQEKDGFAPCAAFPGKRVAKAGWCRAWAAKPA